ncbi:amino acid adenylation domain-containing protein [uncultured Paraglaciecola sp.]|uniref:amino acid adenylation domain-containing protein n=1 Tax=uncultured Paraglaciecola sp. TaxID=1765024 RepID=UPI002603821D|nr:amino acid adenylation domain-containing protein [uncultured Paraglaciecola sp.]
MIFLLHHLVEHYADQTPDADAVFCLQDSLNYASLNKKSNQLAHCLNKNAVKKGDRVGIYMDKSLEMAIAVYAIFKAGAAYVPLDPSAPASRIAEIIQDCRIDVLISADNKIKRLTKVNEQLSKPLTLMGCSQSIENCSSISWAKIHAEFSTCNLRVKIIESDLAYIIYTSGSTGKPKGIMHTHSSGLVYAKWAANEVKLTAIDRIGNHSPLHFDISTFDWFATAFVGASTIVIPDEYTKMPASYAKLIEISQMTVLFTVPYALIQLSIRGELADRDLRQLRRIMYGGEPFPIKHLITLIEQLPQVTFDNIYGPAEINGCTRFTITDVQQSTTNIPIGKISQIAEALVVDENNNQVAYGESGELLVRTPTMMQGYWGRPELNQNVFYFQQDGVNELRQKFYRTGDIVKLDQDQTLWFLGRKDRQIKVRGYRVELDEIESTLVSFPDIEEAAVFSIKLEDHSNQVHGAYTIKGDIDCNTKQLNQYLKERLPSYAIPSVLKVRESFPRTTSDKINRTALSKEAEHDNN